MKNFRLVILDYPKLHLNNQTTKSILLDLIVAKQNNFERTDEFYVPNDKHDLIGTHFLIYDVTNPFQQKLVMGIRLAYEERARRHKVTLPILDASAVFDQATLMALQGFKTLYQDLVDCNSLFVDPNYTNKSTGLRLVDIGYSMIIYHLARLGKTHMIGGTNEKFKSSKWLSNFGEFKKDLYFKHPVVNDLHMLIMLESFNFEYVNDVYLENKDLFDNLIEFIPESLQYKKINDVYSEVQQQLKARRDLKLAI